MELKTIDLEHLKVSPLNVRKHGTKNGDDLIPSIEAIGLLQPLLVRKNCTGYDVIAGQRRLAALTKIAAQQSVEPIPCVVMNESDDAAAIEASLMENISRLPMDEMDQYKAFVALQKQGKSVEDIALEFGVTEQKVNRCLALGNLIDPIQNAFRKDKINLATIRALTLASKKQQKEWYALFKSDEYAPQGSALKEWLFGGNDIKTDVALFDLKAYEGSIISDLFGEDRYFDDASAFWELQNQAIAERNEQYLADGWDEVRILDVGDWFHQWDHVKTPKSKGGRIYVQIRRNGEVEFFEGYITQKEAKRAEKAKSGEITQEKPARPELTKPMQEYLDLNRHTAVRCELLKHQGTALRLCVAQMIASSTNMRAVADSQYTRNEAISESVLANKGSDIFDFERCEIRKLLNCEDDANETIVPRKGDWEYNPSLHEVFSKLLNLDDEQVMRILTFVIAETLTSNSSMVEVLGEMLCVDMLDYWKPDETFFNLLKDKEAINGMLKHVGGKKVADGNIASTAKLQKGIIQDFLNGENGRKAKEKFEPRYMRFPMVTYTQRGGINAIDQYEHAKKHYVS